MDLNVTGIRRFFQRMGPCLLVCTGLLLAGCATAPGANPRDPWEPMNRGVFEFNETFDEVAFKPVAVAYKAVTPRLVRAGVTNFFNNLGDGWSLFNNILQGKLRASVETYFRITVNTILGIGGVFDIASEIGVEPRTEDFGQTLGLWGLPTGPYLVLPFFGPSNVRDALATPADTFGYPVTLVKPVALRNSLAALNAVDKRANYLRAGEMLDESALDKYVFSRDVFLQKRRNDIYDGSPPPEDENPQEPDKPAEKP
jgi:phospholipid-binding lipoprotein MlaA